MRMLSLLILICLTVTQAQASTHKSKLMSGVTNIINEALVKPPVADELCFTPDDPCDIKLVKFINGAKTTLDIAIFDINLDKLVNELILQSKKIPVRILVDRREAKGGHSLVPLLIKAGVQVRYGHQRGIMHNKFVIVDGKMIETGSFNYTNGAAFKNNENQIYLATPALVEKYKSRFEKIWARGDLNE